MTTGMVKQKKEIILWVQALQDIKAIFELQHHPVIVPITFL
jgi:hypothetical protein